jgi:hypothetical protein
MKYYPVTILSDAFIFCRYSVALLLWIALIFNQISILWLTLIIFIFSAFLGIARAPMIVLYTSTFGKLFSNRPKIVVDVHDIRFVHTLAASINAIILVLFLFGFQFAARSLLVIFVLLKSASAIGYCPASKLRKCVLGEGGTCCSVSKIINSKKSC